MSKANLNRRMTSLDASFYYSEHESVPMHIGGIDIIDGEISAESMADDLSTKMHLLPRYQQILVHTPGRLGHPTWEDDQHFDIRNHVVGMELSKPGSESQFRRVTGRLFGRMLDRDKPLWKIYVITGLEGGKTGILFVVHHCMVDGVSGAALWSLIMETSPHPKPVAAPTEDREIRPIPGTSQLLRDGLWETASNQIQHWSSVQQQGLDLARAFRPAEALQAWRGIGQLARDFAKPIPRMPFNTWEFSGKRKLSWSECSFAEIRAIRKEVTGTVNDVVLAALGGGARRYMESHGMKVGRSNLRAMVPVSVRKDDEGGALGNRVSLLPVDIPMYVDDPIERLGMVYERTSLLKQIRFADSLDWLSQIAQGAHPLIQAIGGGAVFHPRAQGPLNLLARRPVLHMVCTNVPGPQIPLYCQGKLVLNHYPLLPVAPGMGLNMGVFSYNQRVTFGFIADTQAAPDVAKFNRFVDEAFIELRNAAGVPEIPFVQIGKPTEQKDRRPAPRLVESNGQTQRREKATA